jgi:hypothetical protein
VLLRNINTTYPYLLCMQQYLQHHPSSSWYCYLLQKVLQTYKSILLANKKHTRCFKFIGHTNCTKKRTLGKSWHCSCCLHVSWCDAGMSACWQLTCHMGGLADMTQHDADKSNQDKYKQWWNSEFQVIFDLSPSPCDHFSSLIHLKCQFATEEPSLISL